MILSNRVRCTALVVLFAAVVLVPVSGFAQQPPSSAPAAAAAPDVNNPPSGAVTTLTGIATQVITPGTGTVRPTANDSVKFSFVVYKQDGTSLKSPANYGAKMNSITVPAIAEGLAMMVAGEKRRIWAPERLAFKGEKGKPAGPVVFDVELFAVIQPPTTPADVAAPPANATKTKSGLASVVLKAGTGTVHPKKPSDVIVHSSGWTTDGKMFDSSVLRGSPSSFPLNQVIAGWTEGVQMMVVGESRRFWIPEKLAYQGVDGKPKGMLVFDIELLSVDGSQQ
jgi:FKBP-type peptidyl-prolyl cis-trans isomerase